MKKVFSIEGITCEGCVNTVKREYEKIGIKANLNILTNKIILESDKNFTDEEIIDVLKNKPYTLKKEESIEEEILNQKEHKENIKHKLLIIGILASIMMVLSMGDMVGLHINYMFSLIAQIIISSYVIYLRRDIFINGYKSKNMNTLISIGVIASIIYSFILIFDNTHELYFETITTIIFFVTLGKYLELRIKSQMVDDIKDIISNKIDKVSKKVNDKYIEVNFEDVVNGDTILIKSGDKIPYDVELLSKEANLDESMLTGESKYVTKKRGDYLITNCINVGNTIEAKVLKINDTKFEELVRLIENASISKPNISNIADKISSLFINAVFIIVLITIIYHSYIGSSILEILKYATSVLVIACPCAIGLAIPFALIVSVSNGAKKGILIRNGKSLEKITQIKTIIFDKTGTLTKGKPEIIEFLVEDDNILDEIYSIEKRSEHIFAKPIVEYLKNRKEMNIEVENIKGYGIKSNNTIIGNKELMDRYNIDISKYEDKYLKYLQNDNTIIFIAKQNEIKGIIAISDKLRDESQRLVKELQKQNIEIIMLSGDNEKVTKSIANKLGITNYRYNQKPIDKATVIKEMQDKGDVVAMVGDGVNDAASLALSDVSIAVQGASDVSIESSDILLTTNNIFSILEVIKIGQKCMVNIKQNLFWGFIYNVIGIAIATGMFGLSLNPMVAAFAMMFSSISVMLNSLRMKI